MKFRLLLCFLLTLCGGHVSAQIGGGPAPAFLPPDLVMPAGKVKYDPKTRPRPLRGSATVDFAITCPNANEAAAASCNNSSQAPNYIGAYNAGQGSAFRILCRPSHYALDDPIVKPRKPGETHLHNFFGNTSTDAQSDPSNMRNAGRSTCSGGIANRTAYWVPVPLYSCPDGEVGCTRSRDGAVFPANVNNAYYKQAGWGPTATMAMQWMATGLQMIAGDANNTDLSRLPGRYDCFGPNTTNLPINHYPSSREVYTRAAQPGESGYVSGGANQVVGYTPAPCSEINMLITFPSCWDGVNLYLPPTTGLNHSANVTYFNPAGPDGGACPGTHPVPMPFVTYNVHTLIPNNADWDYIVLSSDHGYEAGNLAAGSTTTTVVLPASASNVNDYYKFGYIAIASMNQRKQIVGYNGSTRTATLESAFTSAPVAGVAAIWRQAGGITMHGDWADGWNNDANFQGWGHSLKQQLLSGCAGQDIPRYGDPRINPSTLGATIDCHDNNIGAPSLYGIPRNTTQTGDYLQMILK